MVQDLLSKKFKNIIFISFLFFPLPLHASFIEATVGTAVVNDATATYYNPASLSVLKNSQIVFLGSIANFRTHFRGQFTQTSTGFTQSGTASSRTHYYLPSFYLAIPATNNLTVGFAVISNLFGRDIDQDSVTRYVQSNNSVQDVDVVPAAAIKLNKYISLGAGMNISYANFLLKPTSGFPSLNIPDSQSRNESHALGWGADMGILIKPSDSTVIGLNYRSAISYNMHGKSVFEGPPKVISNHYRFKIWTPARTVFSINHFITKKLGLIGTIQYIQSSILQDIHIHGIATRIRNQATIIPNAKVHFHLHNVWLLTIGSHYRITPKWIIRVAGSYVESPSNGNFQISNGDSFILGGSMSYEFCKNIIIDGGYAHAFMKNQNINVTKVLNLINGVNKGSRNAFSLKLTFNL